MFDFLPGPLHAIVPFVIVLGVLVFIHELGHYLAARWMGVHVEAFSIGFGRPLFRWTDRRGTEWRISWLPLGGYVKLHGQERPEDVADDVRAGWRIGHTFQEKPVWRRAIVIAAGPAANFLLTAVLFTGLIGYEGRADPAPVVGDMSPRSAALAAGLRAGDVIGAIDGAPVASFEAMRAVVSAHPGQPLVLSVHRDTADLTITATPEPVGAGAARKGVLGIAPAFQRVGPAATLAAGLTATWGVVVATLAGLWQVISGQASSGDLGGPLRIAQMSGEVAAQGLASLIGFIAILSVNLGLLNLFPIPVLDGGHLMFYAAEAVRGRPLPARALDYGFRAGFAVIVALFVFITVNDLGRWGLFHWVAGQVAGHG